MNAVTKDDPAESRNLAHGNPAKLAALKKQLDDVTAGIAFVEPYGGVRLASGRIANGPL